MMLPVFYKIYCLWMRIARGKQLRSMQRATARPLVHNMRIRLFRAVKQGAIKKKWYPC
jgi:hypothetical protein